MTTTTLIDFARISAHQGAQSAAFEEFCSQLGRHLDVASGSKFLRNGPGADLGVECLWTLPDGSKVGLQAKYIFDIDHLKSQVDRSLKSALASHPTINRYILCVPFDPSAAPGRGLSQRQKLLAYQVEWERLAAVEGIDVDVEIWAATELTNKLLAIDANGGRRLYWFGDTVLTKEWFKDHLASVARSAGPRYTPETHIRHSFNEPLAALGGTSEWLTRIREWRERLAHHSERLIAISQSNPDVEVATFPQHLVEPTKGLVSQLVTMASKLDGLDTNALSELQRLTAEARVAQRPIESELRNLLDTLHGAGSSDSLSFREFHAAYNARFPANPYDQVRALSSSLELFASWLASPEMRAFTEGVLLVTGSAGIGKTHSCCDIAMSRFKTGLLTVVLFGYRFREGPIWDQIRLQLGLDGGWTERSLWDALDAAGETSGLPLMIVIDALNESQPRSMWRRELAILIRSIQRRPNLRLCITCRTGFIPSVLENTLDVALVQHPGFAGIEFDACRTFFSHYGLEPPFGPFLDPEFSNPLFLKLICKALSASGRTSLPAGWNGFRAGFQAFLRERDLEWEHSHQLEHGALTRSLEAIASQMAKQSVRTLPMRDALIAVANLSSHAESIVEQLIDDEMLLRVAGNPQGMIGDGPDDISFAYERLGDHLQVQASLRVLGPNTPIPATLVELARDEPGIAEALAIQLPEFTGKELLDVSEFDVRVPWLRALEWRTVSSIGERAEYWVRKLLLQPETTSATLNALIVLALRPGHRLDGKWFFKEFLSYSQADRDRIWCPYLHDAIEEGNATHPIRRLIDSVWHAFGSNPEPETVFSWLGILCWCFAAADRRVRDRATRAAIRLAESDSGVWSKVCSLMLDVDDDYVVERILASAYGTHLRTRNDVNLADLARVVAQKILVLPRVNAMIRDYARCICELAIRRGIFSSDIPVSSIRPPFQSAWPLHLPSPEALNISVGGDAKERSPHVFESTSYSHRGDFAIYVIEPAVEPYRESISAAEACRWIFFHVMSMGYTEERFGHYDWYIVQRFGGGRGRPEWAERIGKKYQWIALHRLLAHLSDHVPPTKNEWDEELSTLVAQRLRDIDVSIDGHPVDSAQPSFRREADLTTERSNDDEIWVSNAIEVGSLVDGFWTLKHEAASDWHPLEANISLVDRATRDGDKGFRRQIWIQLRSYLVAVDDFEKCWDWIRTRSFMGRWMPEGRRIGDGVYVGEYPNGLSLAELQVDISTMRRPLRQGPCDVIPTGITLGSEFLEDCSSAVRVSPIVPWPHFLSGLHWNGRGGYRNSAGDLIASDPSVDGVGPKGCFVRVQALEEYLATNRMSLLWTVLAEKLPGNYETISRLEYSHVRGLHRGKLRSARTPVTKRG